MQTHVNGDVPRLLLTVRHSQPCSKRSLVSSPCRLHNARHVLTTVRPVSPGTEKWHMCTNVCGRYRAPPCPSFDSRFHRRLHPPIPVSLARCIASPRPVSNNLLSCCPLPIYAYRAIGSAIASFMPFDHPILVVAGYHGALPWFRMSCPPCHRVDGCKRGMVMIDGGVLKEPRYLVNVVPSPQPDGRRPA